MMKIKKQAKLILFTILAISSFSIAGRSMTYEVAAGKQKADSCQKVYDKKAKETIKGQVVRFEKVNNILGSQNMIKMILATDKTPNKTYQVLLAPEWYLKNQQFAIFEKEKVTVHGSRVILDGEIVILASRLEKDEWDLVLRNDNGFPLWRAWRK